MSILSTQQLLQPIDLDEALREPLPQKFVRGLSAPDFYFALQDVREDSRREALSLALPEQVQGLFDLDVWTASETLDLTRVRDWFAGLLEAMPEARAAIHLRHLDPELLVAIVVSEYTVVPIGPDYERDAPEDEADWQSPDGKFWLWRRATPIGPQAEPAAKVLELLYREDPELAYHVLLQAANGLYSEMEELARQFREARLNDMGFPSQETAIDLWNPRRPRRFATPDIEQPPVFAAGTVLRRMRLREQIEGLPAERQESIAAELILLANGALIGEPEAMRDRQTVDETLSVVAGFLELGLELPEGAGLLATDLVPVFQLGLGRVAPLGRRARALIATGAFDRWGERLTLLTSAEADFLRRLAAPRPRFCDPESGDVEPFRTAEQLEKAERRLTELESAAVFFFGPGGLAAASSAWLDETVLPPREERTLDTLLGTYFARLILRQPAGVEPIAEKDVRTLLRNLENLRGFREGLQKLAGAETPLGAWMHRHADRWIDDLRGAAGDPRLVATVLYRAEGA